MSGGITQLVAIGAQDAHLVGSPEVSFFRSTYKRHTNFSQVVERQVIQGNPSAGSVSTIRLERKGDLVSYVYLTKKNGSTANTWTDTEIKHVELLVGGQVIDTQDAKFMKEIAPKVLSTSDVHAKSDRAFDTFWPLQFWFCKNWQSALPLVSLQYHDVEIRITWNTPGTDRYECWADFLYVDNEERQALAAGGQNMLIYQVQKMPKSGTTIQDLVFNHPVKFLCASSNIVGTPETNTLKLQVNGVDVGEDRTYTPHFNQVSPYFHTDYWTGSNDSFFLYPFCLNTNKLQPSGSLNFSRIDNARLVTNDQFNQADIYAVNHNILRIQNGMGGLMYAN